MRIDGRAALLAGLIAGAMALALEMLLVPALLDGSVWDPPRAAAALVLGADALGEPGAGFDAGIVALGAVVRLGLAILFTALLAMLLGPRGALIVVLGFGAVFGLALYVFAHYAMSAVLPWLAGARSGATLVTHVLFGMVAAFAYAAMRRRPVTSAMT